MLTLNYLDFDCQDDWSELRSWDALASPAPHHNARLLAEVRALLAHLHQTLGASGPVDDGHVWDFDLQLQLSSGPSFTLDSVPPEHPMTLSLHLCGREALATVLLACLPHQP